MAVEYRREMNRNYMILEPVAESEISQNGSYAVRILTENRIAGLLPFREKSLDGESRYYYDITSRQPLRRILELTGLSGAQVSALAGGILRCLKKLETYFLDENQLVLEPDFIYLEPDSCEPLFCLVPGRREDFAEGFRSLAQYLLDHVDAKDPEAVVLAFGIFQASRRENFGMEEIEGCLRRSDPGDAGARGGDAEGEMERDFFENSVMEQAQGPEKTAKGAPKKRPARRRARGSAGMPEDREADSGMARGRKGEESRDCDRAAPEGEEKHPGGFRRRIRLAGAFLALASPIALLVLFGISEITRFSLLLFGIEGAAGLLILGSFFLRTEADLKTRPKGNPGREDEGNANETWSVLFREQDDLRGGLYEADIRDAGIYDERAFGERARREGGQSRGARGKETFWPGGADSLAWDGAEGPEESEEPEGTEDPDEAIQTVLLTGTPEKCAKRRLVSAADKKEISISYFPFLIGKSRQIADLCIEEPTVSRLHLRIDELDGGYQVTDLNSTNGTSVSGHALASNEVYPLKIGDEVEIAGIRYRFL